MKKDEVKEAIQESQQQIADRLGWTVERLVAEWDALRQKCGEGVPIYDKLGNVIGASLFSVKGAATALEHLGKLGGRYVEKQEVSGPGGQSILVQFAIPRPPEAPNA